jgi:hypothetical protein
MEVVMNVVSHHSPAQLQKRYRMEKDARLARRIQGVYLALSGQNCPQIMAITGAARRTVQQWVAKYNRGGLNELCDKPRPGQPTRLPRNREAEFRRRLDQVQNEHPGRRLEVWFQDEARFGRRGTFLLLPPYSPELNAVENLRHYFRSHYWSNRTYDDYDDLRQAALEAWRKVALDLQTIRSVCRMPYAERIN